MHRDDPAGATRSPGSYVSMCHVFSVQPVMEVDIPVKKGRGMARFWARCHESGLMFVIRAALAASHEPLARPFTSWRSGTPEESPVEGCEDQDNADIHEQPCPESVSEKREIYTDYNGWHGHHVKHDSYLSAHFSNTSILA